MNCPGRSRRDSAAPQDHVGGTIVPRHLAASGDMTIAILLGFVAGSQVPESNRLLQFATIACVWLAYDSLRVFSTTPCKRMAGLVVVQLNGKRITAIQACAICFLHCWR